MKPSLACRLDNTLYSKGGYYAAAKRTPVVRLSGDYQERRRKTEEVLQYLEGVLRVDSSALKADDIFLLYALAWDIGGDSKKNKRIALDDAVGGESLFALLHHRHTEFYSKLKKCEERLNSLRESRAFCGIDETYEESDGTFNKQSEFIYTPKFEKLGRVQVHMWEFIYSRHARWFSLNDAPLYIKLWVPVLEEGVKDEYRYIRLQGHKSDDDKDLLQIKYPQE